MKLAHLRTACYLYNQFSDYDAKYLSLSTKYPNLQLNSKDQVMAVIEWLRSWGCRQFKKTDEAISINGIMKWYEFNESKLPPPDDCLIDYDLSANRRTTLLAFLMIYQIGEQQEKNAMVRGLMFVLVQLELRKRYLFFGQICFRRGILLSTRN